MRLIALSAVAVVVAAATSQAAEVPSLEASASAGACGGSIGCSNPMDIIKSPANSATVAHAHDATTLVDGSYADATTTTVLGAIHVDADAYRATGSDAQSHADARDIDYIPGGDIMNGVVHQVFSINGSVAPGGDDFGNASIAYFQTLSYDVANGALLNNTTWESTLAQPNTVLNINYDVPTGHDVQSIITFSAYAYSSFGVVDYADYADTLHIYMTTGTGNVGIVGLSGHDYAPPGVPEPATWVVMLVGFGLAGGSLRRRPIRAA